MKQMINSSVFKICVNVFFVVILMNAAYFEFSHLDCFRTWPDEALYAWIAQRIAEQPSLMFSPEASSFHPPFFSAILAVGQLFVEGIYGARIVGFLFNLAGIVLTFLIGKRMYGPFVGVMAGLLLSFHDYYTLQSSMVLADVPITVGYLFLVLAILKAKEVQGRNWHWLVGAILTCILLLKWSGVIAVVFTCVAYAVLYKEEKCKSIVGLYTQILTLPLLAVLFLFAAGVSPDTTAVSGLYFKEDALYYLRSLGKILDYTILIPFLILGLIKLYNDRSYKKWVIVIWIVVVFGMCSLAMEKVTRYIFPALPALFLVTALGFEYIIDRVFKTNINVVAKLAVIVLVFTGLMLQRPHMEKFFTAMNRGYSGFPNAGQWLAQNAADDGRVFAMSRRAIRLFSGVNYTEFGGRLDVPPESFDDFLADTKKSVEPVYLVVDRWEYTQPEWLYPVTKDKLQKIEDAGFALKAAVRYPVMQKEIYVIWIFEYE